MRELSIEHWAARWYTFSVGGSAPQRAIQRKGEAMAKKPSQRKILVIDPRLQFRYLVLPLVVTVTTGACLFALFVMQAQTLKSMVHQDQELLQEIGSVQLMAALAVCAVLLLHIALIVWIGLTASHKVAGPVYRLKKAMREVADGNPGVRIALRQGDELKEAADLFNRMMDVLAPRREPEEERAEGQSSEPPAQEAEEGAEEEAEP